MSRPSKRRKALRPRERHRAEKKQQPLRSKRSAAVVAITCIAVAFIAVCSLVAIIDKERPSSDTALSSYAALSRPRARPVQPAPDDDHLRIQPEMLMEGTASFFVYDTARKTPVRFFIVRLPGDRYTAALDTCKGCYKKGLGYALDASVLVCRKCGHRVPVAMDQPQLDDCHPVRLEVGTDHGIRIPVDNMMTLASQYTVTGATQR